jgi:hypothetical protein
MATTTRRKGKARTPAAATRSRAGSRKGASTRRRPERAARRGSPRTRVDPGRGPRERGPALPVPSALLDATAEPEVVEVPARTVVAIDGAGPPDSAAFGLSVGALYGAAYGLKFARKRTGATFQIGPLEGRWWAEGAPAAGRPPPEAWRWRLRLGVPADVSESELAEVVRAATTRKGGKLEGSAEAARVRLERIAPARLGRILHVGPYADEPRSFAKLDVEVEAAGFRLARSHLEVYLSDPRRTAPERLRTVLLRELAE